MKATRIFALFAILILLCAPGSHRPAQAAGGVYYVDNLHPQANDANPGSETLPWKTIQHAANVALAGDTVYVKQSTYHERVHPAHSGSAGNRITFQALPRRMVTMWGFYTQGSDFLTISGFNITTDASLTGWTDPFGVFIYSNDVEVLDNYLYNLESTAIQGFWHDPYPRRAHVAGNTIYHSQMGIGITGYDWVVENNDVSRLFNYGGGDSDYSRFFGNNHVIRWNHFYGSSPAEFGSAHVDCFQTFDNNGEFSTNVNIEGNLCSQFHQGFMGEGHYYHNINHITFKNNVFTDGWAWGLCVQDIAYLTAVNNTFANIAYHGIGLGGNSYGGVVKNNLFYNIETSYWFEDTSSIDGDYNLIYNAQEPGVTGAHDKLGVDPKFVNPAAGNYHLQAGSPAIDAGMPTPLALQDFDRVSRPQMYGWDMGAFEFLPALLLSGAPGDATLSLAWQVNTSLPGSATWRIDYAPGGGNPGTPVSDIPNATRSFTINGLNNYTVYSITLTAKDGATTLFSGSLQLMPSDILLRFPVISRGF